jgi:hypothetical protein
VPPLKATGEQIRGSVAESGTFTFLPSTVTYDDTLEYEITKVEATRVEAPRGVAPVVEAPRSEAPKLKKEVGRRLEAETLEIPIKELRKTKEELNSRLVAGSKQEVPRLTSSITRPFRDSGELSFDSDKLYPVQAAQQLGVSTPKNLLAKSATRQADIRPAKVLAKTTPGEPLRLPSLNNTERKNKETENRDMDKKEQVLFNR